MKKFIYLAASLFVFAGCNGGPDKPNIEIIQNMMDAPSIKSQGWDPEQGDKVQMRMPPDHAVSRGWPPYKFAGNQAAAEKQKNPLAGNMSPEIVELGHKNFEIYCKVCHGEHGQGDGPVSVKMPVKPRNLMSDEAKHYTDGRIFDAITSGKGVMGSYASQITDVRARWAVVNYVRSLQKESR